MKLTKKQIKELQRFLNHYATGTLFFPSCYTVHLAAGRGAREVYSDLFGFSSEQSIIVLFKTKNEQELWDMDPKEKAEMRISMILLFIEMYK